MLVLGGKAKDEEEARAKLEEVISTGAALTKLKEIVEAQGGDPEGDRRPGDAPHGQADLRAAGALRPPGSWSASTARRWGWRR